MVELKRAASRQNAMKHRVERANLYEKDLWKRSNFRENAPKKIDNYL
jgi:hypothetical protein